MLKPWTRFSSLIVALGLAAACGDDGGMVGDGDGDGDGDACLDHPNVTEMGEACAISAPITAPMTQDLTLTADTTWLLDGPVVVGDDSAETVLTIEAGTTVFGGDGSFVLIQRGSRIMADGTASAPIVLTSAKAVGERGPEDWGGLVINGRAPINNADDPDGSAPGEAGTGRYGGTDPADSSGVIRYLRSEFAGNKIDAENELNGIAFQGVGNGTTVEFVQTHMTSDDGIEFFGGTVDVKNVVITGSDDDSIDWTGGWTGRAQFIVAEQDPASGLEAERGIEADNLEANNTATPFSSPTLSNVTLVGRPGNTADGMRLRRGTKGELHNFVVTGFDGSCITVTEAATEANVADDSLLVSNMVLDCAGGAAPEGAATDLTTGANVVAEDPMLEARWMPAAGSAALDIGASPSDGFMTEVTYAGAFDGTTDWTDGWIETATE